MKHNLYMKNLLGAAAIAATALSANAQQVQGFVHEQSDRSGYEWPTDTAVLHKLDQWQDQKFGVLFHYGLYSLPGIVESWSICAEDVDWITRKGDLPYDEYKKWYWSLADSLNPVDFDPEAWASIMKDAGMKYMLFTTKHHDGFCTFDSKYTDFSIANGPFANDPRSNMTKEVLDAFRNDGFMVGCYFSKPDWHSEWFWSPEFATPNRHINYKKDRHPEWWKNYQDFTANQLGELVGGDYGDIDILWLDGGWVRGDEVKLDSILASARSGRQPGLISVDRAIRGRNENYQTPERSIPAQQLSYPWESCITLSNDWGWVPNAPYKSARKVVNMLAEITAKGGCLALGIGPTASGTIEPAVQERLADVGRWLRANGEAIYGTRNTSFYNDGPVWFTGSKDGKTVYAIYTLDDDATLPSTISWTGNIPKGRMTLLADGRKLNYSVDKQGRVTVKLPKGLEQMPVAVKFELANPTPLYKQADAPVEERVADLLARMTPAEKAGQLLSPMGWEMWEKNPDGTVSISETFRNQNNGDMPVGSYWAVLRADPWTQKTLVTGLSPRQGAEAINALQHYAMDSTRLGIPILFAEECPHGHMAIGATVMPTGLAMAGTWNPELMHLTGNVVGRETALQGAGMGYGPVLDVARDPRWSRMEETFGEDPWLSGVLGTAYLQGLQTEDPVTGKPQLYCTLKHFAAYGVPNGGHNGAEASVGPHRLHAELLLPFEMAVKGGAGSIMTSYNTIDGVPSTGNRYLLTDILRDRWGFDGVVKSDLFSIDGMANVVAADRTEAGAIALRAGVDMDLGAACYGKRLLDALEQGLVTDDDLNRAVANVLRMKFRLGLFDNPYVDPDEAERGIRTEASKQVAREVARQGMALLKNDGMLPLSKDIKRIAVIGPNADEQYNQLGDYTAPQDPDEIVTMLEGIREAVGPDTEVTYVKGCAVRDTTLTDIAAAVEAARNADAVVLVVGGSSARDFKTEYIATGAATVSADATHVPDMDCGEGFDRSTLNLLGDQERLMEAVLATGTPTTVVYIEGRPLDMNLPAREAEALIAAWYPGGEGGRALADIIFGDFNPSGRLPVSIQRSEGQLPVYYSLGKQRDYMDGDASPLYPFGHGLSYTTFEYSDLEIAPTTENGALERVSCRVTNTGSREGAEVVQLYVTDVLGSTAQPALQLRGFERIELKPGESKEVTFLLGPDELSVRDAQGLPKVEPGDFRVMVGSSSADIRLKGGFTLK